MFIQFCCSSLVFEHELLIGSDPQSLVFHSAKSRKEMSKAQHFRTSTNVGKCNCVSHIFEPSHSGSTHKSDRGMIPHSSFIFGLIGGRFVLSSEFIFSWDSENQWPSLMLFKYSHLGCCPVSPNKSCFCERQSRQYFPRIQKQRVFCILTEQICGYIGFSAQQ